MTLCVRKLISLSIIFFIIFSFQSFAQLSVTSYQSAQVIAQKLAGPGIVITNATLTCPNNAYGSFVAASSSFGLDSGIVLTTGFAATQNGFIGVNGNSSLLASNNNGAAGDASLNALAGQNTHDACALEFDFIPKGDSINFQYVFSSEEYINATCGPYNDAFAFFISGPGITGQQNLALIPGTNIPVTINSINSGIPGPGYSIANCNAMGPGSPFTNYFVDNSNGTVLTHKGYTTVLKATHEVTACSTYHLKMVIADAGNYLYDSGVFLKAGSLQATNVTARILSAVNNQGENFIVKGCNSGIVRINTKHVKASPQTLFFDISGSAINGFDFAQIPDSVIVPANDSIGQVIVTGLVTPKNGTKDLILKVRSPYACDANTYIDSVSLKIYDSLSAHILSPDTSLCLGDTMMIRVNGDSLLTYSWSPNNYLNDASIKEPTVTAQTPIKYVMTANVAGAGCVPKIDSIIVTVRPVPSLQVTDITTCNHLPINLSVNVTPNYPGYQFFWSGPNGFSSNLQNPVITNTTSAAAGNYQIKVIADTSVCFATANLNVNIISPDTPIVHSLFIICQDEQEITLSATGDQLLWYTDLNGLGVPDAPVINAANIANYQYFVSQTIDNCESDRVPMQVEVKKCCDGTIIIPSGFSPNNDGKNDVFRLITSYGYQVIQINIYNRWGQLVFSAKSNQPWDGYYNGEVAPTGTYFYDILVACNNGVTSRKTGDITLIR